MAVAILFGLGPDDARLTPLITRPDEGNAASNAEAAVPARSRLLAILFFIEFLKLK